MGDRDEIEQDEPRLKTVAESILEESDDSDESYCGAVGKCKWCERRFSRAFGLAVGRFCCDNCRQQYEGVREREEVRASHKGAGTEQDESDEMVECKIFDDGENGISVLWGDEFNTPEYRDMIRRRSHALSNAPTVLVETETRKMVCKDADGRFSLTDDADKALKFRDVIEAEEAEKALKTDFMHPKYSGWVLGIHRLVDGKIV